MYIWYSIKNRLILFFIIVIIIPSILITAVMYTRSTMILGEKKGDSIINGLLQTCRVIDSMLSDTEYQLTSLAINPKNFTQLERFKRKADYTEDLETEDIWSRMYNLKISNRNVESIYIYLYNEKVMFTSYEMRKVIEVGNPEYYQWLNIQVNPENNSSGWITSYGIPPNVSSSIGSVILLKKLIKNIYVEKPIGEACIVVTEQHIRHSMLESIKEGNQGVVLLLDKHGKLISAVNNKSNIKEFQAIPYFENILKSDKGFFIDHFCNERMLIAYVTSELTGWKYISMVPFKDVILNVKEIQILAFFINSLAIGLAVILALIFSQSIYKPIKTLKESMETAGSGNLTVQIMEECKDEFGMLNRGFNRMITQIQKLINELYNEKLLKKEAELKNLQAQINPHFLYNTLDSVHWLSRLNKMEEVSQLTFSLSNFYRLSLGSGKEMVTVKETIDLIKEYLNIQKIRYGDKLNAQIEADEELLNYYVLHFIIQPLVENSIYHGIEKKKGYGFIKIDVSSYQDNMVFTISDNGVGIPQEQLSDIKRNLEEGNIESGKNFALVNIHRRLQLFYGEEYGLNIESCLNKGTVVRVMVPKWDKPGKEVHLHV